MAIAKNRHNYVGDYKGHVKNVFSNMRKLDDNNQVGFSDKFNKPKWESDGVGQGMRMDYETRQIQSGKRVMPKYDSRMKDMLYFEDTLEKE